MKIRWWYFPGGQGVAAPFRLVAEMRFEGVQEFTMDFFCNDEE